MKDGRVVLTKVEAATVAQIIGTGIELVDVMEAEKNLAEDFVEVHLFKALQRSVELGVTQESLTDVPDGD